MKQLTNSVLLLAIASFFIFILCKIAGCVQNNFPPCHGQKIIIHTKDPHTGGTFTGCDTVVLEYDSTTPGRPFAHFELGDTDGWIKYKNLPFNERATKMGRSITIPDSINGTGFVTGATISPDSGYISIDHVDPPLSLRQERKLKELFEGTLPGRLKKIKRKYHPKPMNMKFVPAGTSTAKAPMFYMNVGETLIHDSTGTLAKRDSSGNWDIKDPARALEVMYKIVNKR